MDYATDTQELVQGKPHHKIENLYLRNRDTGILTDEFRRPEFGLIDRWTMIEKIDGTNVRVTYWPGTPPIFGGRTNRAEMPKNLMQFLKDNLTIERLEATFPHAIDKITLYGEGFGAGIQQVGKDYCEDQRFVLFDICINDRYWLDEQAITEAAWALCCLRAPIIVPRVSKDFITSFVTAGFDSVLAWQLGADDPLPAEGIIAKPTVPLYNRKYERVMFKLKTHDLRAKAI